MIRRVSTEAGVADCCRHAAEIAELRAAIAELRVRVEVLSRAGVEAVTPAPGPASVQDCEATTRTPAASSPAVDRHGAGRGGLPYADRDSPEPVKIGLYRALFAGRSDVYAYRWENQATGEKGWAPKRAPGTGKEEARFAALTDSVVAEHLWVSPETLGLYVMLPDSRCRLLVCDFDDATWRLDAAAYTQAASEAGVPAAVEVSRSGEGAHVWTFFTEPVAAAQARALGAALLREAMTLRGELGLESYDRLFPAQDFLPRKGFGNLIALPLQGQCRKQTLTTVFVDPHTWQPYDDQWLFLSSTRRLTSQEVTDKVEQLQPPTVGPATRPFRQPRAGEPSAPAVVKAELAGMLAIRRAGLPPSLVAALKHLASLHNAEFHDKQRMGLSVWNTPRFLRCYEETLEHLYLPRGVLEQAESILAEAGSRLQIDDRRPEPARLDLAFAGTLRDAAQDIAVQVMSRHDMGVLVAPPGAGKTVMACALIAHHQAPTLVLVDRAPLLQQWRDRLHTHLSLPRQQIGQIGGGKTTRTGVVDLAMLQTLVRHHDPAALLDGYGLVVVDECHHVAATTFEQALRHIGARRWLGLTATPKRTDRRDEIMLMQCGPVRHRITTTSTLTKTLHIHPTAVTLRDDIDSDIPGLLSSIIIPALVADEARNKQVCDHVTDAVRAGRNCLVLAGRTDHVTALADDLTNRGLTPVVLHGTLKTAQRRAALEHLATTPDDGPPLLLVATDRYIGEGFDCPRLDTLFLTTPISSETPITQYVGRILREHPGKHAAEVHDYADTAIPMLARMHGKRLTTYRRLGFATGPRPNRPNTTAVQDALPIPATSERAGPRAIPAAPTPAPDAAQVRAWAQGAGITVAAKGRLRPEVWAAYHDAHPAHHT